MHELGRAALVVTLGLSVCALVAGAAAARLGRRRLALSVQNALPAARKGLRAPARPGACEQRRLVERASRIGLPATR